MKKKSSKTVLCHDVFWRTKLVPVRKLAFRPSVYGVIIEGGRVLLSRQRDGYDFPGGGVDMGETVEQALKREFWEETGLRVAVGMPIWCSTLFFSFLDTKKGSVNAVCVYFICRRSGGRLTDKNLVGGEREYVKKAEWISTRRVHTLRFYNSLKKSGNTAIIRRAVVVAKALRKPAFSGLGRNEY
ncbi:MAG: NUDIX hydrolase [Patescibacteria group bacterium]